MSMYHHFDTASAVSELAITPTFISCHGSGGARGMAYGFVLVARVVVVLSLLPATRPENYSLVHAASI